MLDKTIHRVFPPGHGLNMCGGWSDVLLPPLLLPRMLRNKFESTELARQVASHAITQAARRPVSEPLTGRFPFPVLASSAR